MSNSEIIGWGVFFIILLLVMIFLIIIPLWKIFEKAGKPGWASIVPVYNNMVMAEIGGKPQWWGILTIIPYVGIVFNIWIINLLVQKFGKGVGFTIGAIFLPFIFLPILGYGDATYEENKIVEEIDTIGA